VRYKQSYRSRGKKMPSPPCKYGTVVTNETQPAFGVEETRFVRALKSALLAFVTMLDVH